MADDDTVYLVVGSDSLIGGALQQRLRTAGQLVVGTTRRRAKLDEHSVYLDLLDAPEKWQPPSRVTVAIVCAGVTRLQACEKDPVMSAKINVEAMSALIKNLVNRHLFVIYLSTNQVFDGSKPFRPAGDPVSPQTEYGRQKAAAERGVLSCGESTAIVRFTKVLEPNPPLFSSWIEAMRNGKEIHPFSDMTMAPVPVALAAEGLHRVAQARSPGVFQMSADKDISYEQAARHLARGIAVSEDLVQPSMAGKSGLVPGSLPLHTTLDTIRFRDEFGIAPPNAWRVIDSVLQP